MASVPDNMDGKKTDPVIIDLLHYLKENLPPDTSEEYIIKKVSRLQVLFDLITNHAIEGFYKCALYGREPTDDDCQTTETTISPHTILEQIVDEKLEEMVDYLNLHEEKQLKTEKLDASTAKLDLKRNQYDLITSVKLDSCMDLIGRYNRLLSKK